MTDPEIILSRADSSEKISGISANSKWSIHPKQMKTGLWKIEYRSGKEVCSSKNLTAVSCMDGFEDKSGNCEAVPKPSNGMEKNLQVILAVCAGLVLLIVMGYFSYIARQNPARFFLNAMISCEN